MKLLTFVVTLLTSLSTFAYSNNYTNLQDKRTDVEAVAASNQDGVIALRVVVNSSTTVVPNAVVETQAGGFQCKVIKTILLESAYDSAKKEFTQAYEIQVVWTPGNENSGCSVTILHPSLNNTRAVIYMENKDPSPINEYDY
ncbi:hypothetical protein B9G69_000110 [Bdellovibrio sp. SKB1291214]|uniref:hypothetical protein n=1 Tax=Bdellovibrio sp. SKB1291214 TaxID=1732569 RepID=UPI000B516140|nr:hypothetical protein [Bdellovibrio sp. SKB1291214]UYL08976.1 hypothetical protein B9G69_000110 [Bdellovibrio sp. SKB1291214]